jgi:hypothetical protein
VTVTVATVRPSVTPMPTLVALVPVFARVIVIELPLATAVTAGLVDVTEKPLPPTTETEPDCPQRSVSAEGPTASGTGTGGAMVPRSVFTVTVVRPPKASVMTIVPLRDTGIGIVRGQREAARVGIGGRRSDGDVPPKELTAV